MNKTFIYPLMMVLLLFSVLAAPPSFLTEQSVSGLQITYPEIKVFNINSQVELYFHVHNSSGAWLNNTQVNCTIHMYNQSNNAHLFEGSMTKHGITEFEHILNMSLYSTGAYSYLVECGPYATHREFGFIANGFYLSNTGEDIAYDAWIIPAILILIPLIFGWMLLHWCLNLGEDHTEVKIFMSLGSLMMVFVSLWYGMISINKFFNWVEMQDAIGFTTWMVGIFFVIIWSYFMIYLVKKLFDTAKGKKVERLQY